MGGGYEGVSFVSNDTFSTKGLEAILTVELYSLGSVNFAYVLLFNSLCWLLESFTEHRILYFNCFHKLLLLLALAHFINLWFCFNNCLSCRSSSSYMSWSVVHFGYISSHPLTHRIAMYVWQNSLLFFIGVTFLLLFFFLLTIFVYNCLLEVLFVGFPVLRVATFPNIKLCVHALD